MTNPPVPATPLDVEACMNPERLRNLADRILNMADGRADRDPASLRREAEFVRALASALPGMGKGKDIDWIESKLTLHTGVELLYVVDGYEVLTTTHDGDQVERSCRGPTLADAIRQHREIESTARAAQPEATSADG